MPDPFSPQETALLREHGIVIFGGRVIFDAQAPMSEDEIAAVRDQCAGPLPPALLALWSQTAGGRLDYDLDLRMNQREEAVSWTELFYNGSDAYHDLQGWIDAELELAEEAAEEAGEPWSGRLRYLPIGGFEYLDRVYVEVEDGPTWGQVVAWKKELPASWRHEMHEPGFARFGKDLYAGFAALELQEDPLQTFEACRTGTALLEYLDERVENHGMPQALMDTLVDFYRAAVHDWRSHLDEGRIAEHPKSARLALLHALQQDDGALVARLAAAGVPLGEALRGASIPTEIAVGCRRYQAAEALLQAGAPITPGILMDIDAPIAAPLVARLLDGGATPTAVSIAQCASWGSDEAARLIAAAYVRRQADLPAAFALAREQLLRELAGRVDAKGVPERIARLRAFDPA